MPQYEIVPAQVLPHVDPVKTVKAVVFSPSNAVRVTQVLRKIAPFLTLCYFVGASLFPVMLLTKAEMAKSIAILEAILELPVYFIVFLSLKADLVRLVMTSYDYWLCSAATIVSAVSFSMLLQDWRISVIISRWVGFQVPILIDANLRQKRSLLHALTANALLIMFSTGLVVLNAVDKTVSVIVTVSTHRSFSVNDLLVNGVMTMEILLFRIIIRKYELMRRPTNEKLTTSPSLVKITCVTLRCSIKLQEIRINSRSNGNETNERRMLRTNPHGIQLRHVKSTVRYDGASIIGPQLILQEWHSSWITILQAMGYLGLTLTTMGCWIRQAETVLCISALALTVTFVGVHGLFYNRQLFRRLCFSFDFIFLSFQITAAHLSLSDMLNWQFAPSVMLLCTWLWIHWVITVDALTPDAKARLGFDQRLETVVIGLFVVGELVVCVTTVLWDWWTIQNRVLLHTTVLGHTLKFSMLPFFTSRLLTMSVWTVRLLWRVSRDPDPAKLILLRDPVEFELEKPMRLEIGMTTVVPVAGPLQPMIPPTHTSDS